MSFILKIIYHVTSRIGPYGKELDVGNIRKILLIETNRLGDVVNALPALGAIRRQFKNAELCVVVERQFVSLVRSLGIVDKVIVYDGKSKLCGMFRCLRRIREEQFDLVCSLSPIQRNAFLALLGRKKYALGYLKPGSRMPNFLKSSPVLAMGFSLNRELSYGRENIRHTAAKVCEALAIEPGYDLGELFPATETYKRLESQLRKDGVLPRDSYVVLHPFAGWSYREWPTIKVVTLVNRIVSDYGCSVVVVGGPGEEDRLAEIMDHVEFRNRVFSQAGIAFEALSCLLRGSELFIGTDSGPIHLASALGVPSIGLYGPAPPSLTGPEGNRVWFIQKHVECSPCNQQRCIRPDNSCLQMITVDEVISLIGEKLHVASNTVIA